MAMLNEELTLVRLPARLADIVRGSGGSQHLEYYVEAENTREFVFRIGSDLYYATLLDLPTIIEAQKTLEHHDTDTVGQTYFKSGDVSHMLLVHDVKVGSGARPIDYKEKGYVFDSGITPPMQHAKSRRFDELDYLKKFSREEIERADWEIFSVLKGYTDLAKSQKAPATSAASKSGRILRNDIVKEELIDALPIMDYFNDEEVFEEGEDNFMTSSRSVVARALDRYYADSNRYIPENNGAAPAALAGAPGAPPRSPIPPDSRTSSTHSPAFITKNTDNHDDDDDDDDDDDLAAELQSSMIAIAVSPPAAPRTAPIVETSTPTQTSVPLPSAAQAEIAKCEEELRVAIENLEKLEEKTKALNAIMKKRNAPKLKKLRENVAQCKAALAAAQKEG